MSKLNPSHKTDKTDGSHLNWHGGISWDVADPFLRLRLAAASCFFGEPKYYSESNAEEKSSKKSRDLFWYDDRLSDEQFKELRAMLGAVSPNDWHSLSPRQAIERAIDEALAVDVEKTLQLAVELRNVDHIRSTPQVILVRAAVCKASKGTGLIRKYAPQICVRGDEPAAGLAYFFDEFGAEAPIPNSLKKAWRDKLQSLDEYALSKYRMENGVVKTVDVVNLVRPFSGSIDKLVKGELKQTETWQAITSSRDNSTAESIRENWREAAKVMPHMALLRNLRNLAQNGVDPSEVEEKLLAGVPGGKQLPFRYFSAFKALEGFPLWQDLTERCLEASFANAPRFKGRVMSICDTSGSAWGATTSDMGTMTIAEIGILSGIITGKLADEGWGGVFANGMKTFPIRKTSSVFDLCEYAKQIGHQVGCGTDNGAMLILNESLRKRERWDHLFVYSDMQMGGDYNVALPKLIRKYREEINPNVLIYFVQIGGYVDVPMPKFFDKTFVLSGWSTGVLSFAEKMSKTFLGDGETD